MAQILGKSGRYVEQESVGRRRRIVTLALAGAGTLGLMMGLSLSLPLWGDGLPVWVPAVISAGLILGVAGVGKWVLPKLDELERDRFKHATRDGRGTVCRAGTGAVAGGVPGDSRCGDTEW